MNPSPISPTQEPTLQTCTAFLAGRRLASGPVLDVALAVHAAIVSEEIPDVLVFDDSSSRIVEIDWRGTTDDVRSRIAPGPEAAAPERAGTEAECTEAESPPVRKRGRPKLGVVGREVTLLPRHWDWLATQPGGASVTLRKLVEQARRARSAADRKRRAQESAYRFMVTIAGNAEGFEEASRALFAGDLEKLANQTQAWPPDVQEHLLQLADPGLET